MWILMRYNRWGVNSILDQEFLLGTADTLLESLNKLDVNFQYELTNYLMTANIVIGLRVPPTTRSTTDISDDIII